MKIANLLSVLFLLGSSYNSHAAKIEKAELAAGCFWGTEEYFRKIPGVKETTVGYAGGKAGVAYEDVTTGKTGDAETVQIMFDPDKVSYKELLTQFFKMHDPTTLNQQGNDKGSQYRSAIFYSTPEQKIQAEAFIKQVDDSGAWKKKIMTEVAPSKTFTKAEDYHQKYLVKNPGGYDNHYVREISFDAPKTAGAAAGTGGGTSFHVKDCPSDAQLKKDLTSIQYEVTRQDGTEAPFGRDESLHMKKDGIYVDLISGEPLFSSKTKFDSGTGWPSFYQPLVKENVVEKTDNSLGGSRTEVRSKHCNSHLGHVFDDGPKPTGLRYCMNGAALRFVPKEKMKAEGYGEFLKEFESAKK